jgi:hypothetical protein
MAKSEKFTSFYNPGGFVDAHFFGEQSPQDVVQAINELVRWSKKLTVKKQPILILVDVTDVPKIDISGRMAPARQKAVDAMSQAKYDKIAVYGSTAVQIMVNTLVLIAGKRQQIRVFSSREDALRWLKGK